MAPFLFPLFGIFGLAALMSPKSSDIPSTSTSPTATTDVPLPWYVPVVVVVVGGVLLYKVGAKTLKV